MEHSLNTEVFVNVRPVDPFAITDDLKLVPLGRCCLTQPPRPRQWNADDATVHEAESNQLLSHRNWRTGEPDSKPA
jgi:hypothetical protein